MHLLDTEVLEAAVLVQQLQRRRNNLKNLQHKLQVATSKQRHCSVIAYGVYKAHMPVNAMQTVNTQFPDGELERDCCLQHRQTAFAWLPQRSKSTFFNCVNHCCLVCAGH